METALVRGTVVATHCVPSFRGQKLLWIEPLDDEGKPTGHRLVAVDTTQSGPGTCVFFVRSREAAEALDDPSTPADAAILGIVDASDRDASSDPIAR